MNRFEDALYDDDRLGRPSDLSEQQFQQFAETLHQPPEEVGYDAPAWSSALAQQHLIAEFDVAYSRQHVQRLMNKAEVSCQKLRPEQSSADKEELQEYDEDLKKVWGRDKETTVITIDQFCKTVGADFTYAWFPVNERQTVDVSASRKEINLLGALTETGETMFLECAGSFTKEVTVQFLQALQTKFGEQLLVVLDKGTYFTANKVKEFAEESKIELLYLPTGTAKLNPTEECWRQLRSALGNRYFGSVDELRAGIRSALETINPPRIYQYLCR